MPIPAARRYFARELLLGAMAVLVVQGPATAQTQATPERGVFVSQIGETSRIAVYQESDESLAQIAQDGANNQVDLEQNGTARHRAQVVQDGDDNTLIAEQNGPGSTAFALLQQGNANSASVVQSELSVGSRTNATLAQLGNSNTLVLVQDGSDNLASLDQVGDGNMMTATQEGSNNRLQWSQSGDGLTDLGIVQTGNGNLQVTQSLTGAQFAPAPGG